MEILPHLAPKCADAKYRYSTDYKILPARVMMGMHKTCISNGICLFHIQMLDYTTQILQSTELCKSCLSQQESSHTLNAN